MEPEKFKQEKQEEMEDSFMSGDMFHCFSKFNVYGIKMGKLDLGKLGLGRDEEIRLGRLPHNLNDDQTLV